MAVGKEAANLRVLFDKKLFVETFLGINLIYKTGVSFPGIIIPIASGVTTFLTSRATSDNQPQDPNDPTAGMMKSMNYVMPAIMAIMAGTVPAAVGLYWVISNLIQFVIQKVVGFVYDRNKEKVIEKERQASIKLMEDRINSKNAGKRK